MCPFYMQLRLGRVKALKEKYLSNASQALDFSLLTVDSKTKTNGASRAWPPQLHPCNQHSLLSSGHNADKVPDWGSTAAVGAASTNPYYSELQQHIIGTD